MTTHDMTRMVEYGDVLAGRFPRSNVTGLDEGFSPTVRATVQLVHLSPGYEPAGSAMRLVSAPTWCVWWDACGARHGARYLMEEQARAHFTRLVNPPPCQHTPSVSKRFCRDCGATLSA